MTKDEMKAWDEQQNTAFLAWEKDVVLSKQTVAHTRIAFRTFCSEREKRMFLFRLSQFPPRFYPGSSCSLPLSP